MDELNKNQLILLTLLVSFVTSIATGIITTSLLQEAPPGVTQVINRVVEKTIEQVATEPGSKETIREVTVVVKEEDQVIDAIAKNGNSIARITDTALTDGATSFYGLGVLLSKEGLVVSGFRSSVNQGTIYSVTFGDGKTHQMKLERVDGGNNLAFFRVIKDPQNPLTTTPATLGTKNPQLGQSVIALDGKEKNSVAIGRVTGFVTEEGNKDKIEGIETDIGGDPLYVGAPLLNLSGEVVGVRVSLDATSPQEFISASFVENARSGL